MESLSTIFFCILNATKINMCWLFCQRHFCYGFLFIVFNWEFVLKISQTWNPPLGPCYTFLLSPEINPQCVLFLWTIPQSRNTNYMLSSASSVGPLVCPNMSFYNCKNTHIIKGLKYCHNIVNVVRKIRICQKISVDNSGLLFI